MTTTIQVDSKIKTRLESLKVHPREPFNSVITRLIESGVDREPLSEKTLRNIEKSIKDIETGRVYTTSQLKERLKL